MAYRTSDYVKSVRKRVNRIRKKRGVRKLSYDEVDIALKDKDDKRVDNYYRRMNNKGKKR